MTGNPIRRVIVLGALLAGAIAPSSALAAGPAPFGQACTAQNGVRFCSAGSSRVKTFDGVPLDVDVTLPPTGAGPFPTIVMLHGYGGSKTDFESATPAGAGLNTYHYNNVFFARQGYAVLNYTARGFGHSCGGGPAALPHTGDCAKGYIRLADTRYEARDTQFLVGKLVDQGIARRRAIGVTGISYGGGQSMELAFLKDRIRLPDGSYRPWRSPNGVPLSITAAYPRWPWSDLVSALLPNGRFLDFRPSTDGLSRDPVGVPIQSYINGLFALGQATGYYCGDPAATPCTNPDADLPREYAAVVRGEPITPDTRAMVDEIYAHHQAFGVPGRPAPLLIENGWTDDLFPPSQALRVYNELRSRDPRAPVALQLGDLGHSRGSNKARLNHAFNDQGAAFFAAHLKHRGLAPAPGSVEAFTQTCPDTSATPDGGPYRAASWPAIHPGTVRFGSAPSQLVTSTGGLLTGPQFDPVKQLDPLGTTSACRTIPDQTEPGTAEYRTRSSGFTLLGLPTVRATIQTTGLGGQLDSRLFDVAPDGTARLISRGAYRLRDNQSGPVVFQLNGNGYRFPEGDTVKLVLMGRDAGAAPGMGYLRPSNFPFSVQVSNVTVALPTREGPRVVCRSGRLPGLRLSVRPGRTTVGRATRFVLRVTAGARRAPVRRALVRFAGLQGRTDASGRLTLRRRFHRSGRYVARASTSDRPCQGGPRHAAATIRVDRRRSGPRFTG